MLQLDAPVLKWLTARIWQERAMLMGGAALAACSGLIVTCMTYLAVYMGLVISLGWVAVVGPWLHVIALIGIALLFWGNATTDSKYLEDLKLKRNWRGWAVFSSEPDSAHSLLKLITATLYQGPRLLQRGWNCWLRAQGLKKLDVHRSAGLLAQTYRAGMRVNVDALQTELSPDELDQLLKQLIRFVAC